MRHFLLLLLELIFLFALKIRAFNGYFCDDRKIPKHSHVTKTGMFKPCNWDCNSGYTKVRNKCCPSKPNNSTWSRPQCSFICDTGLVLHESICCPRPPDDAVWLDNKIDNRKKQACDWTCPKGFLFDGKVCVDEIIFEILQEHERKEKQLITDAIVDSLLEEEIEVYMRDSNVDRNTFIDDLINRLLEHEDINYDETTMNWMDDLVDKVIKNKQEQGARKANQTMQDIDALGNYLHNQTIHQHTANDQRKEETREYTSIYDSDYASNLEAEARATVDSLDNEVEFLRATIRFQQDRLKRKKAKSAQYDQLERDLAEAQKQTIELKKLSETAHLKLKEAQQEVGRRKLSVNTETVEIHHAQSLEWKRIYGAVLDTGNANVCTLSYSTAKTLGLSQKISKSKNFVRIMGVIPGKVEQWPLIDIKLRIKGRVFEVKAAVGGGTPLLVSHPDVIERLMKEDKCVIAA